ncbi:hypothetical protein [Arthrobacter sp. AET 35A]|uniref:hypothetical protein n=1 Tax=Arthrobacter sp. AET 35A TaxID=2292643 RepID=UPI00178099E1|nr:hypothetical protein [Arthrobacter sp. AET 35A]
MNLKPAPAIDTEDNSHSGSSDGSPLNGILDVPDLSAPDLDYLFTLGEEDLPALPPDLSTVATDELCRLCNLMFQEMNKDFPRFGAREDYAILVQELQSRPEQ